MSVLRSGFCSSDFDWESVSSLRNPEVFSRLATWVVFVGDSPGLFVSYIQILKVLTCSDLLQPALQQKASLQPRMAWWKLKMLNAEMVNLRRHSQMEVPRACGFHHQVIPVARMNRWKRAKTIG